MRGMVAGGWSLGQIASLSVDYGIDRFYVPEGEGMAIEHDMRVRPFRHRWPQSPTTARRRSRR